MIRALAALLVAMSLVFGVQAAVPAEASIRSSGCVQNFGGGCIWLDNDHNGDLWVHTVQPGVWGAGKRLCGYFQVRLTRKSNGIPTIIRSKYDCPYIPSGKPVWGPKWTLDKWYADGDIFCGAFTAWNGDRWGCVTVHSSPPPEPRP